MKRGLISVAAAVGVLAALVIAPVQSASAYPPGTAMKVSASPSTVSAGARFTASASNVKPGCSVVFNFGGKNVSVASAAGKASTSFTASTKAGTYRLTATCLRGESASTNVKVVGRAEVHGASGVCMSKSFTMKVSGFAPNSRVSVVLRKATPAGGSRGRTVSFTKTATTNSSGAASYRFKVNRTGVFVVSAVGGGQRASTAVSVSNC
jgi:hypothetical protein